MSASVASVAPFEPASIQAAAVDRSSRLALLDTARVVAALGIVWVHAATSPDGLLLQPLGTFGVPFYTFIAVLFMARTLSRDPSRTLIEYARTRFSRIYMPFLFWTVIYVAMGFAKSIATHQPRPTVGLSILYAGGFEHLWFLPFLMVVTLCGAVIFRAVERRAFARALTTMILILLGVGACMLSEPTWIAQRTDDLYFWKFAFRALPTVFWSIALALLTVFGGKLPRTSSTIATGGALLLGSALMLEAIFTPHPQLHDLVHPPEQVLRSLAGLGCLLVALLPFTSTLLARIGKLGRHSYGIYLSHIVFLRIIAIVTERLHTPASLKLDVASFVLAFIGASVLSVLLSQSVWTRWTVGE